MAQKLTILFQKPKKTAMTTKRLTFGDMIERALDEAVIFSSPSFSSLRGQIYNPEDFDLVPKRNYLERQIKFKEEEIARLKQRRDNELKYYESQEKKLNLELEQLKQRLSG